MAIRAGITNTSGLSPKSTPFSQGETRKGRVTREYALPLRYQQSRGRGKAVIRAGDPSPPCADLK